MLNALVVKVSYLTETTIWFNVHTTFFPFGAVIGVILCGKLINTKGRYFWILLQNILGTVGSILSYFIYSNYVFVVGRFVWGLSIGFVPLASLFYIKEIVPSAYSSRYLATTQIFMASGTVIPFIIVSLWEARTSIILTTLIPIAINGV